MQDMYRAPQAREAGGEVAVQCSSFSLLSSSSSRMAWRGVAGAAAGVELELVELIYFWCVVLGGWEVRGRYGMWPRERVRYMACMHGMGWHVAGLLGGIRTSRTHHDSSKMRPM